MRRFALGTVKKNTIVQLTGPASLSQALHRGQGKTGTSLPEGAAFPHILQHAINKARAVKASKGQICCWCQSAGCNGGRQMWLLLAQMPLEVPPDQAGVDPALSIILESRGAARVGVLSTAPV